MHVLLRGAKHDQVLGRLQVGYLINAEPLAHLRTRHLISPAREPDGQQEQHADPQSPAEQSRSPGHQKQHLPERLPHPAQHYGLSAARPIYTPRPAPNASICPRGWGRVVGGVLAEARYGVKLDWTWAPLVSKRLKRGRTNLSSPRRLFTSATMT